MAATTDVLAWQTLCRCYITEFQGNSAALGQTQAETESAADEFVIRVSCAYLLPTYQPVCRLLPAPRQVVPDCNDAMQYS